MILTKFLDRASAAYYAGHPIISDEVFDNLAESINYNKIGAKQHEDVYKHAYPMYSLQKFYEDEGKQPLLEYKDKVPSVKLDGAAVSLLYADGVLIRALTRGDGVEGRDVTDKFLSTNIVPHNVENLPGLVQITGEVVAPKHIENARNYAAGCLNLKGSDEFKTRAVVFIAYGVYPYISDKFSRDMLYLETCGFRTIFEPDLDKVFPTDGLVFRINDNATFDSLGYTAKFPRGAYAKKERKESIETELLDVVWQVGKTGKVTPVAILKPVLIGDALVSRATLNNPGFIEALDLRIGDIVGVIRSGEIIPCITHKVGG